MASAVRGRSSRLAAPSSRDELDCLPSSCQGVLEALCERQMHGLEPERICKDAQFAALTRHPRGSFDERRETGRIAEPERREARPENVPRHFGGRCPPADDIVEKPHAVGDVAVRHRCEAGGRASKHPGRLVFDRGLDRRCELGRLEVRCPLTRLPGREAGNHQQLDRPGRVNRRDLPRGLDQGRDGVERPPAPDRRVALDLGDPRARRRLLAISTSQAPCIAALPS